MGSALINTSNNIIPVFLQDIKGLTTTQSALVMLPAPLVIMFIVPLMGRYYDEKNPVGDNYVDFGIYDTNKNTKWANANKDFVNGYERSILLDFNVDGDILNNI